MKEIYPSIMYQLRVDFCKNLSYLPYDFYILNFNIIIELDGMQHFSQIQNWDPPEKTRKNDIFKMKKAIESKYNIIRLFQKDIWEDNYDWKTYLQNKISYLILLSLSVISSHS